MFSESVLIGPVSLLILVICVFFVIFLRSLFVLSFHIAVLAFILFFLCFSVFIFIDLGSYLNSFFLLILGLFCSFPGFLRWKLALETLSSTPTF